MPRSPIVESRSLRIALLLDSMLDGGMGLACILAAGPVVALLGLPAESTLQLRIVGILLIAGGALLLWMSAQHPVNRVLLRLAVVLNALWVVATLAIALVPLLPVTDAGRVLIVAQALILAVLVFIEARHA
jgi:hypothetical protein